MSVRAAAAALALAARLLIAAPCAASDALFAPDVVVVLGCQNSVELEARVAGAARLLAGLRGRARPRVVLSGGAPLSGRTEADVLAERLEQRVRERSVRRRFLRERRSLDTVGNALFTALLLRERGVAAHRVLVVTSGFHAHRAGAVFEHVLGPRVAVAVVSAGEPLRGDRLGRRVRSERDSERRTRRELFAGVAPGDLDALSGRVRRLHALYRR